MVPLFAKGRLRTRRGPAGTGNHPVCCTNGAEAFLETRLTALHDHAASFHGTRCSGYAPGHVRGNRSLPRSQARRSRGPTTTPTSGWKDRRIRCAGLGRGAQHGDARAATADAGFLRDREIARGLLDRPGGSVRPALRSLGSTISGRMPNILVGLCGE